MKKPRARAESRLQGYLRPRKQEPLTRPGHVGQTGASSQAAKAAQPAARHWRTRKEQHGMDAIIMAAGLGTRLRPHTLTTPKPLLPVRGRPILDWALGALPPAVDRVIVVVHYLAEQIERYLVSQ